MEVMGKEADMVEVCKGPAETLAIWQVLLNASSEPNLSSWTDLCNNDIRCTADSASRSVRTE